MGRKNKDLSPGRTIGGKKGSGGRFRKRKLLIYAYQPMRCGDDISTASGYEKEACRRPLGPIHVVVDGIYAMCRACIVKIIMAEVDEKGRHPHDRRFIPKNVLDQGLEED